METTNITKQASSSTTQTFHNASLNMFELNLNFKNWHYNFNHFVVTQCNIVYKKVPVPLSLGFSIVSRVQVTKSAPVAHCPGVCGDLILSHSWQHSACLRVTSPQLTGVTGRRRQLRASDHAQVSFITVRSYWPPATLHSCYVGGASRTADRHRCSWTWPYTGPHLSQHHCIQREQADKWCRGGNTNSTREDLSSVIVCMWYQKIIVRSFVSDK